MVYLSVPVDDLCILYQVDSERAPCTLLKIKHSDSFLVLRALVRFLECRAIGLRWELLGEEGTDHLALLAVDLSKVDLTGMKA